MIIDLIENSKLYNGLGTRITKALNYLEQNDFEKLDDGRYEIEGNDVYASVSRYKSKLLDEGKWEAHKRYIDVQFVASGTELIGYSFLNNMTPISGYDSEKDFQLFKGNGQFTKVDKNTFMILFPSDAHMPGIAIKNPENVIKVVIKVKV
jgi:YhcH/YjgK/YiaL family protein